MLRLLLVFVLIPMALVGCGQTPKEKAKEGNEKISRMNDISRSVAATYGIVLASASSEATIAADNNYMVDQLSKAELQALQPQVQEFRNLSSDVMGIIDSGDVTGGDRYTLERAQRNADNVLRAIAAKLAKAA